MLNCCCNKSPKMKKIKFKQVIGIIDELHEKNIILNEIPDFMIVQKVKPKLSKENASHPYTWINESQNMINVVKRINEIKGIKETKAKKRKK